jgi:adenylate kinase family enzyme
MLVVVVGPCGSGKTTLVARLKALGYMARTVAQEHSHIRELWKHGGTPDALIFLDASANTITRRRQNLFPQWLYSAQLQRLRSARAHASLYLHTDRLSAAEVQRRVLDHLRALHREIAIK